MKSKLPYRLLEVIGSGGWAKVWRAVHRDGAEEIVAFKRPHSGELAARRMRREIKIQRRFAGPHVMPILDADEEAPWFVMPLAEGNLKELWNPAEIGCDREAIMFDVLSAAAAGLREAHGKGSVHRDLTPANILAMSAPNPGDSCRWVVADWGLAGKPHRDINSSLTPTGQALGTAGFAAPETLEDSHRVDPRADVYSAGRIMAWLLTDKWPRATLSSLPPIGPWRGVIAAATEQRPADRPADLDALLDLARKSSATAEPRTARQQARQLINASPISDSALAELRTLARRNQRDERLYINELARLPLKDVERWVRDHPEDASSAAIVMCTHLRDIYWIGRDFNEANAPLRWAFTVLTTLVNKREYGYAEDVAVKFFSAEEHCDRYEQLSRTCQWLRKLADPAGVAMARAIRHAGASDYYRRAVGNDSLASTATDDEIGQ